MTDCCVCMLAEKLSLCFKLAHRYLRSDSNYSKSSQSTFEIVIVLRLSKLDLNINKNLNMFAALTKVCRGGSTSKTAVTHRGMLCERVLVNFIKILKGKKSNV